MKLKAISLISLMIASTTSFGSIFVQKFTRNNKESIVILNQKTAHDLNLDIDKIKSELNVKNEEQIIIKIDDNNDVIDLDIYNNEEFASSRVDRDGVGH